MADATPKEKCVLMIQRINCASCVEKIEGRLSELSGVYKASVNFANGKATVEFAPQRISAELIAKAVTDIGYPAHVMKEGAHHHQEASLKVLITQTSVAFACSIPLGLHMLGIFIPLWVQIALATIVQFGCGYA